MIEIVSELPDMSPARLTRLRERLCKIPFAAELASFEKVNLAPAVFDLQLDTLARFFTQGSDRPARIALNPLHDDDTLVSFYVHELRHMRQFADKGVCYMAHPAVTPDHALMVTFVTEADAYAHQSVFCVLMHLQGDREPLKKMFGATDAQAESFAAKLAVLEPEAQLKNRFDHMLTYLMSSPSHCATYFGHFSGVMDQLQAGLTKAPLAEMKMLDAQPASLEHYFSELKAAVSLASGNSALGDAPAQGFLDKLLSLLPRERQQAFSARKIAFVSEYYAEMDGREQTSAPKIWVPKSP